MKQYLVAQHPKRRYRHAYSSGCVIINAETKESAIRLAAERYPDHISLKSSKETAAPSAREIVDGMAFYI
jgi:hypothetical protein